ncbi:MAG: hypothetical protein Q8Q59_11215 [Luteolibacter sp.]|nr:hypothetical protein [Luteolibacter sp.]
MRRPYSKAPSRKPVTQAHVGPNWKLIRNLFIIAGLVLAILIAWENLGKAQAQRDLENRQAKAKLARAREKAEVDAKNHAAERANRTKPQDSQTLPPAIIPRSETPEEILTRLRNALASGNRTEMPPGTVHQGNCDYFLIAEPMTWPEASAFAAQHGGQIAIPTANADLSWLLADISQGHELWLGASRGETGNWTLPDGKPWTPATQPTGTDAFLAVDKRGELGSLDATNRLPFIIQWGYEPEPEFTIPTAAPPAQLSPEHAALAARARELILAAERKRSAQLAENVKTMTWNLEAWVRTLPKSEQTAWLPHIKRIKDASSHGRAPSSIPESSGIEMSQKMAEISESAAGKQIQIDSGFLAEAGKIHHAYLAKIQNAITEAKASGKPSLADALGGILENADSLDAWLNSLGIDSSPAAADP